MGVVSDSTTAVSGALGQSPVVADPWADFAATRYSNLRGASSKQGGEFGKFTQAVVLHFANLQITGSEIVENLRKKALPFAVSDRSTRHIQDDLYQEGIRLHLGLQTENPNDATSWTTAAKTTFPFASSAQEVADNLLGRPTGSPPEVKQLLTPKQIIGFAYKIGQVVGYERNGAEDWSSSFIGDSSRLLQTSAQIAAVDLSTASRAEVTLLHDAAVRANSQFARATVERANYYNPLHPSQYIHIPEQARFLHSAFRLEAITQLIGAPDLQAIDDDTWSDIQLRLSARYAKESFSVLANSAMGLDPTKDTTTINSDTMRTGRQMLIEAARLAYGIGIIHAGS